MSNDILMLLFTAGTFLITFFNIYGVTYWKNLKKIVAHLANGRYYFAKTFYVVIPVA